jgi:hypothetical protein
MPDVKNFIGLGILFVLFSCKEPTMEFDLTQFTIQYEVPSASGLVYAIDRYFAIGDDAPYLYELDSGFELRKKHPIHPAAGTGIGRIPKKDKPDFEAMEMVGEKEILIFGSGSKADKRNGLLRIFLQDPIQVASYDLSEFYAHLKSVSGLGKHFNIEAAAYSDGNLYLFNRTKNRIFLFNYGRLLAYLSGEAPLPEASVYSYTLPSIGMVKAGFSGATFHQPSGMLIVTASVEVTDNPIDDGVVLGSFIGTIPTLNGIPLPEARWLLLDTPGEPVKVESITVTKSLSGQSIAVAMTTDSDGGASHMIRGVLRY